MPLIATMPLWPLVAYFGVVVVMVAGILALSWVLGQRRRDRQTGQPYESGMVSTGSARGPLSAEFYLIAMFFVIFDLEAVFLFAYAIAYDRLGWAGYVEMLIFVGVLAAALGYLWKVGALDWGTSRYGKGRLPTSAAGGGDSTRGKS
jgi:NADH-quinone oxidoreductase subunit A